MLRFNAVVRLSIAIIIMICTVRKGQAANLTFVHVVFRHGDRTPVHSYPTDPWKNVSEWPVDWGQLTNIGKEQHYELGKWLRARYKTLLHDGYSTNLTFIQSTDVDRTLMSAQANLAGLFPPKQDQDWSPALHWNPIPVHTIPEILDEVLAAKRPCPKYDLEFEKYVESPEQKKLLDGFAGLFEYLTNKSGSPVKTFADVRTLNNILFIEELYNKTLPEWTKTVYYRGSDMDWITNKSFEQDVGTPALQRIKSGFLLKEMLTRFQNKSRGILDPDRSFWVYSAHDSTVARLMKTLGILDTHFPPYASCIMLELWMNDGQPFVKIFYKNSTEARFMKLPNCDELCPLAKMYELYRDVLPGKFETECEVSLLTNAYANLRNSGALIAVIAICIVLCGIILVIIFTKIFSRRFFRVNRY